MSVTYTIESLQYPVNTTYNSFIKKVVGQSYQHEYLTQKSYQQVFSKNEIVEIHTTCSTSLYKIKNLSALYTKSVVEEYVQLGVQFRAYAIISR